jgi:hypothetical protein
MKTALFLCAVSITLSSVFSLHSSNQDIYVESKINLACVREKGSHKSEKSIQLSLQAIQSNFLGADQTTDGNNGLPITIPIEINVTPRQQKSKMVLDIDAFVFTLTEKGFLISQTVLPQEFAPTSARWIDFDAGNGVVGHVFRDGSIRFSGPENEPLNPGTYLIPPSKVAFSQVRFPTKAKGFFSDDSGQLVRKKNFSISQGLSNLAGFVNGGFNYAEYYGLTFREGNILTVTTDNSFDNSQVPIAVFNKLNNQGEHLISQVNVVPPGYARSVLGEESLSSNPCLAVFWEYRMMVA